MNIRAQGRKVAISAGLEATSRASGMSGASCARSMALRGLVQEWVRDSEAEQEAIAGARRASR